MRAQVLDLVDFRQCLPAWALLVMDMCSTAYLVEQGRMGLAAVSSIAPDTRAAIIAGDDLTKHLPIRFGRVGYRNGANEAKLGVDGDMMLVAHGGHGDIDCVLGTVGLDCCFGELHHPAHIGILLDRLCWLFWPYFASQLARLDGLLLRIIITLAWDQHPCCIHYLSTHGNSPSPATDFRIRQQAP
jgi:hypothetical protein